MSPVRKPYKVKKPRTRRGEATVRVGKAEYEALVIRSRTLHALGKGGGTVCPSCQGCLMVGDRCPNCGRENVISEA